MPERSGKFYLGRKVKPETGKAGTDPVLYDPDDLTTHGVIIGMTGSGKTGLGLIFLEEAALAGLPALIIDPKGDASNHLLHFPKLTSEFFLPWADADQARRAGVDTTAYAAQQAKLWSEGLKEWGLAEADVRQVAEAADFSVYTPGSTMVRPLSVLSSLRAPRLSWEEHTETLREKVSSTGQALLALVGIEGDPVQSREHILLANLLEHAWRAGEDMSLEKLVQQIQTPPFQKLGAMELQAFYPSDDRRSLALRLNNLLAAPSFQAWTEGDDLDIERLLWTPGGKPRHTVLHLAHLGAAERMFFVTLFLESLESWMHTQSGSSSLRALLYIDEVLGYLPPVAIPPSKPPLLRLMKQARAFGLGVLLSTQNPVDLDYKALANAGTWCLGKLQTAQDKARLLDGLEGADVGREGFKRKEVDSLLSRIGPRTFLLHNVHEREAQLFHTRWAMAYLRGPMTREDLRRLGGETPKAQVPVTSAPRAEPLAAAASMPSTPDGVAVYILPNNVTWEAAARSVGIASPAGKAELVYRPAVLAQATARVLNRKEGIDAIQTVTALAVNPDPRGIIRWEDHAVEAIDLGSLPASPLAGARFGDVAGVLLDAKRMKQLEKDFLDFAHRRASVRVFSNQVLKLTSQPGMDEAAFRAECQQAATQGREAEAQKIKTSFERKLRTLQDRLSREERELAQDQAELAGRKFEELATHGENLWGLFGGRRSQRRLTSSLTKRRLTTQAKADVDESVGAIEGFKRDLEALQAEMAEAMDALDEAWADKANQIEEVTLTPSRKDVLRDAFGLAWVPHWAAEGVGELLGFGG
ncbi:MAG TPA: hypothetical protein VFI11_09715 [Anaerolineales bacterium]|nr:hypothetical protein [Anaerolineales bacterium]